MESLTIFGSLMTINNRATEGFKMFVRDKTPLDDEWRRMATLLFSVLFGIFLVGGAIFSGSVSFAGTWLEPFLINPFVASIVGGASISMVSAIVQPIIERFERPKPTVEPQASSSIFDEIDSTSSDTHKLAA